VEHVDELVRPSKPLSDKSVADLREPEPVTPADVFPVEAAPTQSAAATVEEFLRTESPPPIETEDFQVAFPETPQIIDEHVFGPAEAGAPVIDEYVEDLLRPEAPPIAPFDSGAAPAEPLEPIFDEYLEELRLPEAPPPIETIEVTAAPAEPIEPIVDAYVIPARDVPMTPPASPPAPDPRLAALWDAATLPTEAESAPPSQPEPASFITEDVIAETRPLEIPEEPYPAQEFPPEQTIEFAPPPVEFTPPPLEFAPEPPAIVEPEPQAWAEPLVTEPEPALTFPELRVADERGLHQIQIVISPIHSFPRLLDTEARIRALSTVSAVHLRDFRNGIATFAVAVGEAISAAEFGAVIQMLDDLHLRLEGTTQTSVELRAEDEPSTS